MSGNGGGVQPVDKSVCGLKHLSKVEFHFSTNVGVVENPKHQRCDEVGILTGILPPKLWMQFVAFALGNMTEEADAGQSFPLVIAQTPPKLSKLRRSWTFPNGKALLDDIMEVRVDALYHAKGA